MCAWRYDEQQHVWWDDEPTYSEVRSDLPGDIPLSLKHPGGVFVAPAGTPPSLSGQPGPPWQPLEAYPRPLDPSLGYLALPDEGFYEGVRPEVWNPPGLDALREASSVNWPGHETPPVEQTLQFPEPPSEAAPDPDSLPIPATAPGETGLARTAGEQDHTNPWWWAGEPAEAPTDIGRPADG